ncbi:MAG: hypothetical protein IKO55_15910, partial [Kiritimatiellae bacterium]|nr:hypothetical protein [Kiritimatiellia bacterium]
SCAADTHLILREHKEDGFLVLEAVVRSFPRQEPIVLQKAFPLMLPDYDRNPEDLAGKAEPKAERTRTPYTDMLEASCGVADIVDNKNPLPKTEFVIKVREVMGLSARKAAAAVDKALREGKITETRLPGVPLHQRAALFIMKPETDESNGEETEDGSWRNDDDD